MPFPSDIRVMQTADAMLYREMLHYTGNVNVAYCKKYDIDYECYVGIKQGAAPWQATYNRIFLMNELFDLGFRGWLLYLDADAFISDFNFDVRDFILGLEDCCFMGASGGSETPWNINAGVYLLNFGDPEGQFLIREWLRKFHEVVPTSYLQDKNAKWDDFPNDQDIMYLCLQGNHRLLKKTKKAPNGLMNYTNGSFIRQAIRAGFKTLQDRVAWIKGETSSILSQQAAQNLSTLELEDEFKTVMLDYEIRFTSSGNGDQHILSGFSKSEKIGAWMLGKESTVRVPRPSYTLFTEIDASMTIVPAIQSGQVESQNLTIISGNDVLFNQELNKPQRIHFKIPNGRPSDSGDIILNFHHDNYIRWPEGAKGDTRPFAVCASVMQFRAQAQRAANIAPAVLSAKPSIFQVRPQYALSHRMFQAMVADSVQKRVPGAQIVGVDLDEWGISSMHNVDSWGEQVGTSLHRIDVSDVARMLRARPGTVVSYPHIGARMENLLPVEHYRSKFPAQRGAPIQSFDDRFIVINIRQGNILSGEFPDYPLIPIEFYREIVNQMGKIPVFMGQTESSPYMDALRLAFPDGIILQTRGPLVY